MPKYIAQPASKAFKSDIKNIERAINQLVGEAQRVGNEHRDHHHDICTRLCDEMDLWELALGETRVHRAGQPAQKQYVMPMWLTHMVSGAMREAGLSS